MDLGGFQYRFVSLWSFLSPLKTYICALFHDFCSRNYSGLLYCVCVRERERERERESLCVCVCNGHLEVVTEVYAVEISTAVR
jgi:hypothetical protein